MPSEADQPMVMPGGLVFLAAMWLIGSCIVTLGLRVPVHASSASYEPGVRLLLVCVAVGWLAAWPMLRLSQPRPSEGRPVAHALLDVIVLLSMLQLAIWLPRVLTTWPVMRMAGLDAMLGGWTVLTGAVVASAAGRSGHEGRGPRVLAMAACLAICLGGPASITIFGGETAGLIRRGPLMGVFDLAEPGSAPPTPAEWRSIGILWIAALAAWLALAVLQSSRANVAPSLPGVSSTAE